MSKAIAAFGEVMMRLEVPGYQLLSQSNQLNYSFSGTGVNITSALAQFGHSSYLLTTLPNNSLGDAALAYMRKLGIRTDFVQRKGNYMGMYFLESGFGNRSSRVTYSNRQESSFNTINIEANLLEEMAKAVDMVHFCGIGLAMNDQVRKQMKVLAQLVKQCGGKVVFDCNYRPSLWGDDGYKKAKPHYEEMLALADIVMMNEKDALYTLGMESVKSERTEQVFELIPKVAEKYKISVIAGTHRTINGNQSHTLQGFMFKDQSITWSNAVSFSVLDRIGAGDAYTSGILHGVMENFSSQKIVNFSIAAAMLAHTIVGDTPHASEQDVLRAIDASISDVVR